MCAICKRNFENALKKVKKHCGKPVLLCSDFGEFFFMCRVCGLESNAFDSHSEHPDEIALNRIKFKKAKA